MLFPDPTNLQRKLGPAIANAVVVVARHRVEAGVKVACDLLGLQNRNRLETIWRRGKVRVDRIAQTIGTPGFFEIDVRDLPERVDASIGAPSPDDIGEHAALCCRDRIL